MSVKPLHSDRRCEPGFALTTQKLVKTCQDIDECKEYKEICVGTLQCTNTVGSYVCGCKSGYRTSFIGIECFDIDECINSALTGLCPEKSKCRNTPGSFNCDCYAGYEGDNCTDVNECSTDVCHTEANCKNLEWVVSKKTFVFFTFVLCS